MKLLLILINVVFGVLCRPLKQAGKPDVSFTISEATAASLGEGVKIPSKHKVLVQGVQSQCLCVFSESLSGIQHFQKLR